MCSHCRVWSSATTWVLTLYVWKRPIGSCWLSRQLTVVHKDSFKCSESSLFIITSSNANEGETHCLGHLCHSQAHLDTKMTWKMWPLWLVNFTERTGGNLKQATFTIISLIANVSYAKGPCCAVAVCHQPHFLHFYYLLPTLVLIRVQNYLYVLQSKMLWHWKSPPPHIKLKM